MYAFHSIDELEKKLALKEVSRQELLQYFLDRFAQYDPELGSSLEVFKALSILEGSQTQGPLSGIPGLIKDNIAQAGRPLTCASRILENFVSPYDATVIARLKQAGALLLGRANMDEFAMGSSTETSAYKKTCNPWDHKRVPGGSSGGSIAAVAAGLVPWSLGSDTGGSVRQPSGFCSTVGLKPTYGLVSRFGLVAYGSSLDQIGVITRGIKDNARVLSVIAGQDTHDSSTKAVEQKDYTANLTHKLSRPITIGIIKNALYADGMDAEVVAVIENAIVDLKKLGVNIAEIELPTLDYSAAAYFIISRAEAASNLSRFDGVRYGYRSEDADTLSKMYSKTRNQGFGSEVKTRIITGNYVLSAGHAGAFYDNARKVQGLIRAEFLDAFKHVDLLLMPTQPAPAFEFGAYSDDKLQIDLQDYFTCSINLAGLPAISIPCGFTKNKLPLGMQLIGPDLSEELIYQVAYAYEQATEWHTIRPPMYE